ncbi:MAG: low molecular weight phosphatase family protein, partial [Janthinobacterium lividum]
MPNTRSTTTPCVVFVCVRNAGKSQLAAGLMRRAAGPAVVVDSAGTKAGGTLNPESVQSLAELGVDISDQHPRQLTDAMLRSADLVVVLGAEARVGPVPETAVEVWAI